jgi:hypothetical protein
VDEAALNDFSRRFSDVLFRHHPGWRSYAAAEDGGSDEGGALVVRVPAPNPAADPLLVTTDDDEVMVAFDYYHSHFCRYSTDVEEEAFGEALRFIGDILAERVKAVSWWSGATWRGSVAVEAGAAPGQPTWTHDVDVVRVRSWAGTHDSDGCSRGPGGGGRP